MMQDHGEAKEEATDLLNPHILKALAEGVIIWKDATTQLAGLHSAWICFCQNSICPNFQIVWVSEQQELPTLPEEAENMLYQIGWGKFDSHWLCYQCFQKKVQQERHAQ